MCHTTVADDLDANAQVFRQAAQRADLIVSTGGLGPTADDLTRDALAAVAGVELVLNEAALAHIESLFARRKRPMPERNRLQAMFPRGSRVIPNPQARRRESISNCRAPANRRPECSPCPACRPRCTRCGSDTVAPAIAALMGKPRVIRHKQIKCFGVGESDLEQMLGDMIRRGRDPQVGITVHGATITLRITAAGDSAEACFESMAPTIATIREKLGELVFGGG